MGGRLSSSIHGIVIAVFFSCLCGATAAAGVVLLSNEFIIDGLINAIVEGNY